MSSQEEQEPQTRDETDRKVYVVNNAGHDYSPALHYGKLIFLSQGLVNKFNLNTIARLFAKRMRSSSPDDYILMSGLIQLNMIAAGLFAQKHGRANILLFTRDQYDNPKYVVRSVDFEKLINYHEEADERLP